MTEEPRMAVENKLRALAEEFGGIVSWKWDGRFGTAITEFSADMKDEMLALLEKHLVSSWDSSSVKKAPDVVQEIARNLGGIMAGQFLLLSDSNQAPFIFCAWWPWGNGTKISIRLAPFSKGLAPEDAVALTTVFRDCFKI